MARVLLQGLLLLILQACAPVQTTSVRDPVTMLHRQPLSDQERARLGRVGIATVVYQSRYDTPDNSILDTARDVMQGALGGAAGGAVVVLISTCVYTPLFCPAAVPIAAGGAVVGAAAGAAAAVPQDHGRQPEGELESRVAQRLLAETVQHDFSAALAGQATRAHGREILRVDRLEPDPGQQHAPGDELVQQAVESLIDARITAIVLERSGENRIRPVLYTRAWVVDLTMGDTVGDFAYSIAGDEMNVEDLDEQGEARLIAWARNASARVASYYVVDIFGRLGPGTSAVAVLPVLDPETESESEPDQAANPGAATGSSNGNEAATQANTSIGSEPVTEPGSLDAPDPASEATRETQGEKKATHVRMFDTVLDLLKGNGDAGQTHGTNTTGPQPGELP